MVFVALATKPLEAMNASTFFASISSFLSIRDPCFNSCVDSFISPYPTNLTENGNRRASGPVQLNSVTFIGKL